jgi:hypothetical protein
VNWVLALQVVAEVSGCHNALKTSAPIILGTIPLTLYQPVSSPMPVEGSDTSSGMGSTVPCFRSEAPPPFVQPSIPFKRESECAPSASSLSDGGEEYKQPNIPFHRSTAPSYPDIRTYKSFKIIFLMLGASIVTVSV